VNAASVDFLDNAIAFDLESGSRVYEDYD